MFYSKLTSNDVGYTRVQHTGPQLWKEYRTCPRLLEDVDSVWQNSAKDVDNPYCTRTHFSSKQRGTAVLSSFRKRIREYCPLKIVNYMENTTLSVILESRLQLCVVVNCKQVWPKSVRLQTHGFLRYPHNYRPGFHVVTVELLLSRTFLERNVRIKYSKCDKTAVK